jgi:hypothetical protein
MARGRLVIDASVAIKWHVPEPGTSQQPFVRLLASPGAA